MQTRSLLLNPETWDIGLDDSNNFAIAENPYACTQDVATACSTFRGECIYDTTIGLPYKDSILGFNPSSGTVQTWLQNEALRLPIIAQAQATIINNSSSRISSGVITVVDTNGTQSTVTL
ncbi:hypothetical protein [Enterobacter roggenkampii]|uniref:hypothetical protein n=1 Tax=Enterobacter roggenkampii TaxID=1812935 RepID=UPI0039C197E6